MKFDLPTCCFLSLYIVKRFTMEKSGSVKQVAAFKITTLCCLLYLSRLLYLAFSANLGLLCMPHPGMGPQFNVPSEGRHV